MAVPTTYVFSNGTANISTTHSYANIENATNLVAADLLVKVQEGASPNPLVWVTKTGGVHYTVDKPNTRITFTENNVPVVGTKNIRIERYTDVESAEAVFAPGSAVKSLDLNKNQDQLRRSAAELTNTKVDTITPTIQGPIKYEDGHGNSTTLTFNSGLDLSESGAPGTVANRIDFPNNDGTVIVNTMAHNKILVGTTQTDAYNQEIMRKATIVGDVTLSHDNSSNEAKLTIGEIDHDLTIDNKELVFKDGTGKTLKLSANNKADLDANRTVDIPDANGTLLTNRMSHNKILVGSSQTIDGEGVMKKADVAGDVTLSHDLNTNVANITIGDIDHDLTIDNKELIFKDGTGKTLKVSANNKADLDANRSIDFPDFNGTVIVNRMGHNKILVGSSESADGTGIMKKASVVGDVTLSHDNSSNEVTLTIGQGKIDSGNLDPSLLVTNSEHGSHTANDTSLYTTQASDARFYRKGSADDIEASGVPWSGNDSTVATTAAIDKRIIDLVEEVGGFVPIESENHFPNENPDINDPATGGTIVSIAELSENIVTGSGVTSNNSIAQTIGGTAVTINGLTQNTTYAAGFGMLVETTSTLNTYNFHRLTPKATEVTVVAGKATEITTCHTKATEITTVAGISTEVTNVAGKTTEIELLGTTDVVADMALLGTSACVEDMSILGTSDVVADLNTLANADIVSDLDTVATNITDVSNFADLYQIATSAPSTDGGGNSLAAGDLWFDSSSNKVLKVYDGSAFAATSPSQSVLNDIANVSGQLTYKEDLGGIADSLTTETGNNINTVANNINNINTFSDIYRVAASAPSSSLDEGDLWYDSTGNVLKYYNGTTWTVAASAGLSEIGEDTTPELGGNLDCNNKNLTEVGTVSGDNLQIDFGAIA